MIPRPFFFVFLSKYRNFPSASAIHSYRSSILVDLKSISFPNSINFFSWVMLPTRVSFMVMFICHQHAPDCFHAQQVISVLFCTGIRFHLGIVLRWRRLEVDLLMILHYSFAKSILTTKSLIM